VIEEFTYHSYPRVAEPRVYGIKDGKRQRFLCIPDRRLYVFWQDTGLAAHNSGQISGLSVVKKGQKFVGPHDNHSVSPRVIGIYDHHCCKVTVADAATGFSVPPWDYLNKSADAKRSWRSFA
jgi:hypothetical protein